MTARSQPSVGLMIVGRISQWWSTRKPLGGNFWLYFSGQLISQIGSSFTLFALPLLVFKLTHSATDLAITAVATYAPYLLFGLLLGALVDRVDRKKMMVLTDIARGAVIAVLPSLALAGLLHVALIYAVGFVQATLGILFECGEFAAVPSLVGMEDLVSANSKIMMTNSAGMILGPLLAGLLVIVLPVVYLLFFDAGSFVVSAGSLLLIRRTFNDQETSLETVGLEKRHLLSGIFGDVKIGLKYVWSNPVLRTISILSALINLLDTTINGQLVLFTKQTFAVSDSKVALFFAGGAAGILVISPFAAVIRRHTSYAVAGIGALVISGLLTAAMAVVGSYWLALACWGASSGIGLLLNIYNSSLRQAVVPNHLYGRVLSIAAVLALSAVPLGAFAGAAAIEITGSVRDVYAAIGLLTALVAICFAFSPIRSGDRYLAEAIDAKDEATR